MLHMACSHSAVLRNVLGIARLQTHAHACSFAHSTPRRKLWLEIARRVVQQGDGQGERVTLSSQFARHSQLTSCYTRSHKLLKYSVLQFSASAGDQSAVIAEVMGLLREAGGLLRIEDVLPLFPDFVTIDAFKVCWDLAYTLLAHM